MCQIFKKTPFFTEHIRWLLLKQIAGQEETRDNKTKNLIKDLRIESQVSFLEVCPWKQHFKYYDVFIVILLA